MPLTQIDLPNSAFSDEYHKDAFMLWYSAGKPNVRQLYQMLPDNPDGRKPSHATLHIWVKEEFMEKAMQMDQEVIDAMQDKMIQSKVEMLERHVELSRKMQAVGFKVLDQPNVDISVGNAVRLIIEGVRIERESNGIPDMLRKMALMTDDQLMKEIQDIATKSPVDIEAIENE
jgi:hypothetical protein